MDNFIKEDLEEACRVIASMISKIEKSQEKFAQGTSHHTLQKNRIKALHIAALLITKELAVSDDVDYLIKEDLNEALDPINSLISKSEKSQMKLAQGSWQHKMLGDNLKALYIASLLLTKALEDN